MKIAVRDGKGKIVRWVEVPLGEGLPAEDEIVEVESSAGPASGVAVQPAVSEARVGIVRNLKVIRVGPNPRLVSCEYWELAERRVCRVNVRDNRKWLKGMEFEMVEPVGDEEYERPWVYVGKAPRRKGRW